MNNAFLERLNNFSPRSTCSFIATTTALLIGAAVAGASGIAAAKIGSNAAKKAGNVQADAAKTAAQLQADATKQSLDLQKSMFDKGQQNIAPWLQSGQNALTELNGLLGPGGKLREDFGSYDQSTAQFDPGFAYRMEQSNKALQSWAASKGGLFSGGTGMKLVRNAQDMTNQEYQNAVSRSQQNYTMNRDTFYQNQGNLYNRLSGMSAQGENAATGNASLSASFGANAGATGVAGANAVGQSGEAAAAAQAAGGVGAANAWTGALSNLGNLFNNNMLMNSILGSGNGSNLLSRVQNGFVPNIPMQPMPGSLTPNYAR